MFTRLHIGFVVLALAGGAARGASGDPDLSRPIRVDAQIRHIDGGQLLSILDDPFPDDSLVGCWIAVRTAEDVAVEYFRIIANEHFDQWNISVFEVAEDLASAGIRNWWLYDENFLFTIYAPQPEPVVLEALRLDTPGIFTIGVPEEMEAPCTIEASSDMHHWQPVAVVTPSEGIVHFNDPAAGPHGRAYRLVSP